MENKTIIKMNHVNKVFFSEHGYKEVIKDISLEVKENEFVVLFGPGQCGKTTLINLIAGLETAEAAFPSNVPLSTLSPGLTVGIAGAPIC